MTRSQSSGAASRSRTRSVGGGSAALTQARIRLSSGPCVMDRPSLDPSKAVALDLQGAVGQARSNRGEKMSDPQPKKPFTEPHLVVYGDIQEVTKAIGKVGAL